LSETRTNGARILFIFKTSGEGWENPHIWLISPILAEICPEFNISKLRRTESRIDADSLQVASEVLEEGKVAVTEFNKAIHRKERKAQPQSRTRMTRIGRIYTDTANPRNPRSITFALP
jgi:hypothetical protein